MTDQNESDMDVADVLDAAADYLYAHGWTKNRYGGNGNPACVLGSLYEVEGQEQTSRYYQALKAMEQHIGVNWLPLWNDNTVRDATEAIDALHDCAVRVRLGEIKP